VPRGWRRNSSPTTRSRFVSCLRSCLNCSGLRTLQKQRALALLFLQAGCPLDSAVNSLPISLSGCKLTSVSRRLRVVASCYCLSPVYTQWRRKVFGSGGITKQRIATICNVIGPIPWGHSGPLCHALSLSSSSLWTSMRRQRATVPLATSGELA